MASSNDITKAQRTYARFVGTLKWVVPLLALTTLIVILLIA